MLSLVNAASPSSSAKAAPAPANAQASEAPDSPFGQLFAQAIAPVDAPAPQGEAAVDKKKEKALPEAAADAATLATLMPAQAGVAAPALTTPSTSPTIGKEWHALTAGKEGKLSALGDEANLAEPSEGEFMPGGGDGKKPALALQDADADPGTAFAGLRSDSEPDAQSTAEAPVLSNFAAALTQATASAQEVRRTEPVVQASVQAPVHSTGFAPELSMTVATLAKDQGHEAQLQLNPSELGPIRVNVKIDGGEASVNFHAALPETRAAIEAAMPVLKDMLMNQGLQLTQSSVSDQGPHSGFSERQGRDERSRGESNPQQPVDVPAVLQRAGRTATGGIDLYA